MDTSKSMNEFDSLQFTSTSTPMTSSNPSQKKRQLIKEINRNLSYASPANKKMSKDNDGPVSKQLSEETMPDLFDYDRKGKRDRYSFEDDEKEEEKEDQEETTTTGQRPPRMILSSSDEGEEDDGTLSRSHSSVEAATDEESSKENHQQQQKKLMVISSDIEESSQSDQENDGDDDEEKEVSIQETSSEISKETASNEMSIVEDSGSIKNKSDEKVDDSLIIIEEDEESASKSIVAVSDEQGPSIKKEENDQQLIKSTLTSTKEPIYHTIPVQHGRLYGGKMTDERLQRIQGISNDMINAMHDSLSTLPENVTTEAPKGLRIDLMPHQKTGLAWLLWREEQRPPGGILADDMGLGKTLAMISLILHKKNARKENQEEMGKRDKQLRRRYIDDPNLIDSNTTLVVAPASLIFQWKKEIQDRVKDDRLKVHVFHGPKSKRDIAAHRIAKYDIMLVSELKSEQLNLIGEESSDDEQLGRGKSKKNPVKTKGKLPKTTNSVLTKIAWERIILDEAHEIRNKLSLKARCCSSLEAVHRWCLTGTPIHNKLWDLFSLIRFLKVTPFNEEKMWKVMTNSASSAKRVNVIVKSILLRRTKDQKCAETNKPIVDLQPKKYELVHLELQPTEKHCYSIMFEASKQKVRDLLKDGGLGYHGIMRRQKPGERVKNPFIGGSTAMDNNFTADNNFKAFSCILALLLRLRQACVHLSLTKNAIDIDAFKQDNGEIEDADNADDFAERVLEMSMAQMSLDGDGIEAGVDGNNKQNGINKEVDRIFKKEHKSTKVAALMEHLDHVIDQEDKCVIVSQWTSMLAIVEYHLKQKGVSYTSITGEVKTDERQARVDNFNRVGMGPRVMLLSLTAGGVGLNLVGGNHLFLVDLHWNPALEQQASDRIYRLGQKKNVFIHKFVCTDTIEQRVLQLQEKKMAMATSVLEGAAKKLGKLTRDDVMYLFELDQKKPNSKMILPPTQSHADVPKFIPGSQIK